MSEENKKQFSIMDDGKFMEFLEYKFGGIHESIDEIKNDLQNVKSDLQNTRSEMVTKSFVTEKIADLKGELVLPLKKENEKIDLVVEKLGNKKVLDNSDIEEIKGVEVFGRVA